MRYDSFNGGSSRARDEDDALGIVAIGDKITKFTAFPKYIGNCHRWNEFEVWKRYCPKLNSNVDTKSGKGAGGAGGGGKGKTHKVTDKSGKGDGRGSGDGRDGGSGGKGGGAHKAFFTSPEFASILDSVYDHWTAKEEAKAAKKTAAGRAADDGESASVPGWGC